MGVKSSQLKYCGVGYNRNFILQVTSGIEVPGEIRPPLALALFVAWVIVFFCVLYGIRSSGKVRFGFCLAEISLDCNWSYLGLEEKIKLYANALNQSFFLQAQPAWICRANGTMSMRKGEITVPRAYNVFRVLTTEQSICSSLMHANHFQFNKVGKFRGSKVRHTWVFFVCVCCVLVSSNYVLL